MTLEQTGTLTLAKPDPEKLLANFSDTLNEAGTLAVKDRPTADRAGEILQALKGAEKLLLEGDPASEWEGFNGPVKAADQAHKFLTKLRGMTLAPYIAAYDVLNGRLIAWETEERRKAEQAARDAEEAARKAEEERKIREAVAAEEAGDKAAAEEILSEPVTTPAFTPPAPHRIPGRSPTTNYSAVCDDLLVLAKHVLAHPEDRNLLQVNESALNARARSQKDAFKLAGCRLVKTSGARTRVTT